MIHTVSPPGTELETVIPWEMLIYEVLWFHRITEWFGCSGQGHLPLYIGSFRAPYNLTWNVSRDGASTTSLGNLLQCFTTLMLKNFFQA